MTRCENCLSGEGIYCIEICGIRYVMKKEESDLDTITRVCWTSIQNCPTYREYELMSSNSLELQVDGLVI